MKLSCSTKTWDQKRPNSTKHLLVFASFLATEVPFTTLHTRCSYFARKITSGRVAKERSWKQSSRSRILILLIISCHVLTKNELKWMAPPFAEGQRIRLQYVCIYIYVYYICYTSISYTVYIRNIIYMIFVIYCHRPPAVFLSEISDPTDSWVSFSAQLNTIHSGVQPQIWLEKRIKDRMTSRLHLQNMCHAVEKKKNSHGHTSTRKQGAMFLASCFNTEFIKKIWCPCSCGVVSCYLLFQHQLISMAILPMIISKIKQQHHSNFWTMITSFQLSTFRASP